MSKRPRGFAPNSPQDKTLKFIDQIKGVTALYSFSITVRQVFYRLIASADYGKTANNYDNLGEIIGRARRSGLISMDDIRDDGFTQKVPSFYDDTDDFYATVHQAAKEIRFDRQRGQETRLAVWCEAAGMVPQLEMVAGDYGIQVLSSGGVDSITSKHMMAQEFAKYEKVEVLHLGDYDPSGIHMFTSLTEDIQAFAEDLGGNIKFTRLAVTPQQIEEMRLPTAPVKKTDRRSFDGVFTVQCEAIEPDTLSRILRDAIIDRMDSDIYQEVLAAEAVSQKSIATKISKLGGSA
jgi:hypothetical protein